MRLRERFDRAGGVSAIVGSSEQMAEVRRLVQRVADASAPVLIRGETGAGKEMVARAIHREGGRSDRPFIAVNCSALPGALIESLVFGHEKGAFTGALQRTRGQLELAGKGTILLDEIAEMPNELQAKLLRVLEDRRFRPLGAENERPLRARVLAATHADLEQRMREGSFREDLYYRLNVVSIHLPALDEHDSDIPELVAAIVADLPRKLRFSEAAMEWLVERRWPGNVRELRNLVERLAILAQDDWIDVDLVKALAGEKPLADPRLEIDRIARSLLSLPRNVGSKLDAVERAVLHHAMQASGGNKSAAARLLGVERKTLERRWDRHTDGNDDGRAGESSPEHDGRPSTMGE